MLSKLLYSHNNGLTDKWRLGLKFIICVLVSVKKQTKTSKKGIIQNVYKRISKGKCVMRFGLGFLFACVVLLISACSSGPSESEFAPKIGDIETSIIHSHPSYYSHLPAEEQRTIGFVVSVSVTDPDGPDDITDIYISHNNGKRSFLRSSELNSTYDCSMPAEDLFKCSFYSSDQTDNIDLSGYQIVAVDRHGYSSSKVFEFKLPAGAEVEDQEFVYSDVFLGGTPNGIAGLEVMTISGNQMVFTIDEVEKLLHLEFVSNDSRVSEYALELYDNTSPANIIGEVLFDTKKIQENEISPGVKVVVDIPWAQISFIGEYTASDINGLHVVLFDEATVSTQLDVESEWFNYRGYSELITLAP